MGSGVVKILVHFLDDARVRAEITIVPSWLGRLFGRKARRGVAVKGQISGRPDEEDWFWETTDRQVDSNFLGSPIATALETQPVEDLPRARLASGVSQ